MQSLLIAVTCLITLSLQGSVALGATAQVTGGTLTFTAAPGEANDVAITRRFELDEQQTIGQLVASPLHHALVVDREGGAIALWAEYTRAPTHPRGDPERLLAAYSPPGGAFGTPQVLDVADHLALPGLAVDDAGNAVAVWQRNSEVRAAFRPADSVFGAHQNLAAGAVPHVAMNASGEAVAVWYDSGPRPGASRYAAAYRPAGGIFGPAQPIATDVFAGSRPQVAINDSGEALVVWRDHDPATGNDLVKGAIKPPGGFFGTPQEIAAAESIDSALASALGPTGEAATAWEQWPREMHVAERPPGGAFGPPRFFASRVFHPRIAIDDEGNMLLLFDNWEGDGAVFASYRPLGGEFGSPVLVYEGVGSHHADFGADGSATIAIPALTSGSAPPTEVRLVSRARDGRYSAPVTVSNTPGHNPVEAFVGAAPNGGVVVLWRHDDLLLDDQRTAEYLLQAVRGREELVVRDSGARLAAGAGCEAVDSHTVACRTDVTRIQVLLGNRDDRAVIDAAVPATVNGGQAKDVIDTRNGVVDQVSCGQGKDTVDADAEDVVAGDCE